MKDIKNSQKGCFSDGIKFFENRIVQRFLSTKNAASLLGITPNALRIRVFRNQIRSFKDELSGELRFLESDLLGVLLTKET